MVPAIGRTDMGENERISYEGLRKKAQEIARRSRSLEPDAPIDNDEVAAELEKLL